MKAQLLKQLRGVNNQSRNTSRKYYTFLVCFLIAFAVWLMLELGKKYTTQISVPVVYNSYPGGKLLVTEPPKSINFEVSAKGSKLLVFKIFGYNTPLNISLSQLNFKTPSKAFSVISKNSNSFKEQLGGDINLLQIKPDTLFFEFADLVSQPKQVKLNINIEYQKQYMQTGTIQVEPRLIEVSGPQSIIDTLRFVYAKPIKLDNVNTTQTFEAEIESVHKLVSFSTNKVKVKIPVSQFTENEIKLNIDSLYNLPTNVSAKLFPKQVKLIYTVPLTKYKSVSSKDFQLSVNFSESKNFTTKRLNVNATSKSNYINILRVEPNKVEYIIRK